MDALSKGRFYAVRKGSTRLLLDLFQVRNNKTGNAAILGQELDLQGYPLVEGRLSVSDGSRRMVDVSLIRGGAIMESFKGETPLEFHFVDQDQRAGYFTDWMSVVVVSGDCCLTQYLLARNKIIQSKGMTHRKDAESAK